MAIKLLMCNLRTVRKTISGSIFPKNATDWQLNPPILKTREKYPNARVVAISNESYGRLDSPTRQEIIESITYTLGFFPMTYVVCCPDDGSNAFYIGCSDLGHYVRDLPAQSPGHYRKPSPGMLLWTMEKERVKPGECLFLGNCYMDKYAATAAGVMYQDINEFE